MSHAGFEPPPSQLQFKHCIRSPIHASDEGSSLTDIHMYYSTTGPVLGNLYAYTHI